MNLGYAWSNGPSVSKMVVISTLLEKVTKSDERRKNQFEDFISVNFLRKHFLLPFGSCFFLTRLGWITNTRRSRKSFLRPVRHSLALYSRTWIRDICFVHSYFLIWSHAANMKQAGQSNMCNTPQRDCCSKTVSGAK